MRHSATAGRPLVSIVVPFLDAERFLAEAIESVFRQTYDCWELILVDDGSSDGGPKLAQSYAERYPESVRLLTRPDQRNPSAARNYGIRHADGTYVAFLDADDVWMPKKLEQQVAAFESEPEASAAYGTEETWYSWTGEPQDALLDAVVDLVVTPDRLVRPPELLRLVLESKIPTPSPSCFAVRRDALERLGGFDEAFCAQNAVFEDQVLLSKIYLGDPVYVSSECWVRYRRHPDSRVSQAARNGQKVASGRNFCEFVAARLREQGVTDAELWRALDKKRWRYRHPTLDRHKRALIYRAQRLQALVPSRFRAVRGSPPTRSRS